MGYSNFDKVSAEGGFFLGPAGKEREVISASSPPVRVIRVPLNDGDTGGGVLSWDKPTAESWLVTRFYVRITTKPTVPCVIDFGTTPISSTYSADNIMDGIEVPNTGALPPEFDNITNKGTDGRSTFIWSNPNWITGSVVSGSAAGLQGYAYIVYSSFVLPSD